MNFSLDDKTPDFVEKSTGMDKNQLNKVSLKDVEHSCNSEPFYRVRKPHEKTSYGSAYLFRQRILSLDKVNRYLSRI